MPRLARSDAPGVHIGWEKLIPHFSQMLKKFIFSLKKSPKRNDVFNPWWEVDTDNDIGRQAPFIRRQHLLHYLSERLGWAKYLLVAEAVGYQGGHFSGIPMTSERILLGGLKKKGLLPDHVFSSIRAKRTSRPNLKPLGYSEPTATIVWGHIITLGLNPKEIILWNAYPWHPYDPPSGCLSNRTPDQEELQEGSKILIELIKVSGVKNMIAIGEKAYDQLNQLGQKAKKVRHPANGGARKFREQFAEIISSTF